MIKFKKNNNSMLTFVTPNGHEVIVGQNARENDLITFNPEISRANDLWIHADGVAGAHIILKATVADHDCIRFAKTLALEHSKAGNSKRVIMAYCGDIEKKKGSKSGEVVVLRRI